MRRSDSLAPLPVRKNESTTLVFVLIGLNSLGTDTAQSPIKHLLRFDSYVRSEYGSGHDSVALQTSPEVSRDESNEAHCDYRIEIFESSVRRLHVAQKVCNMISHRH